jgi:hypothetical protein
VAEMTKTQGAGRRLPEKLDELGVGMLIKDAATASAATALVYKCRGRHLEVRARSRGAVAL